MSINTPLRCFPNWIPPAAKLTITAPGGRRSADTLLVWSSIPVPGDMTVDKVDEAEARLGAPAGAKADSTPQVFGIEACSRWREILTKPHVDHYSRPSVWHAIVVHTLDRHFFGGTRSAGIVRIKSAGSLPSTRASTMSMPSPTLASPTSMRTKYALDIPARAANDRCDIPISARAATTLRARARVSSLGAASASAADGVPGRRFALTQPENTIASRRHPSAALPEPTGKLICLRGASSYAESAPSAPYRKSKYLLYIGLCSGFSVDNPHPRSRFCVNTVRACSQFCARSGRRSVNNFALHSLSCGGRPAGGVADSARCKSVPPARESR